MKLVQYRIVHELGCYYIQKKYALFPFCWFHLTTFYDNRSKRNEPIAYYCLHNAKAHLKILNGD